MYRVRGSNRAGNGLRTPRSVSDGRRRPALAIGLRGNLDRSRWPGPDAERARADKGGLQIEVLEAERRRIHKVRMRLAPQPQPEA